MHLFHAFRIKSGGRQKLSSKEKQPFQAGRKNVGKLQFKACIRTVVTNGRYACVILRLNFFFKKVKGIFYIMQSNSRGTVQLNFSKERKEKTVRLLQLRSLYIATKTTKEQQSNQIRCEEKPERACRTGNNSSTDVFSNKTLRNKLILRKIHYLSVNIMLSIPYTSYLTEDSFFFCYWNLQYL